MGPVAHVEQLDRRGRVVLRTPVLALPARIGRSPACEVLVDDPYVEAEHLRLEGDGDAGLAVVDLGSRNGTFAGDAPERRERIPLSASTLVRIGQTRLRVRPAADPVPDARPLPAERRHSRLARSRALALTVVALAALALTGEDYLSSWEAVTALELASQTALVLLGLAAWAGGWSLVNRIVSHDFRFAAHWAVACLLLLAWSAATLVVDYAIFLLSPDRVPRALTFLGWGAAATGVLLAHVSLYSSLAWRRRVLACALAGLSVVGVFQLSGYVSEQEFSAQLAFPSQIEPYADAWLSPRSTDTYYAALDDLHAQVDALAAEEAPAAEPGDTMDAPGPGAGTR